MIYHKGLVTIMLLLFLFVLVSNCLEYNFVFAPGELRCKAKERDALLRFKQGLIDEYGILSSWGSEEDKRECCIWKGIKCSIATGHVIGLYLSCEVSYTALRGKISSALLELSYLNHLDLSYNDFGYDEIPKFIGSLQRLQYLNLGYCNFSGVVPHQLRNLTKLRTLDLSWNELVVKNCSWLSHLSLLSLLDLSQSYLKDTNLLQYVVKLPSLTELHLSSCHIPTHFYVNSSSTTLSVLDLSNSDLTTSSFHWLFNMSTNLHSIDLFDNQLSAIPDAFGKFTFLEYLDLSYIKITGGIPDFLGNFSHLHTLHLSGMNLSEPLSQLFYKLSVREFSPLRTLRLQSNKLSGCIPNIFWQYSRLEVLDLSWNQITGSMPDLSALVSLKELYLGNNKLKLLPASLWQLSKLETLDVSFNSIEGVISDVDLSKLHKLKVLDLSFNSLVLNNAVDWAPPFKLDQISLACCKMGHRFPTWLQTQTNFSVLDLSSTGVSDEVPKWLWDLSKGMIYLNLSHNQISGIIPDFSLNVVDFFVLD